MICLLDFQQNSRVGVVNEILGAYLDEGKGASTRPDNKQPLERTVIEMRYGISDKIDQRYVAEAQEKYEVQSLLWYDKKKQAGDTIPDFANFIMKNGVK